MASLSVRPEDIQGLSALFQSRFRPIRNRGAEGRNDDDEMDMEQALISTNGEVRVHGEMTIYRASEVAGTLLAAVATHEGDVSLDLSAVTEFDTAGLQLLLMARRLAESNGHRLDVVQPSECVAEVLGLCNVSLSSDSQQQAAR